MTAETEVREISILETGEGLVFSYGPQHPGTGHFRMIVRVIGDTVVDLDPDPGFVHRGEEKMCEYKTWITNIPHLERPAILDAAGMVYPYCLAVEKLMGVEPPERAKYIRPLVAELNRIGSHFYYFALYGVFLGLTTPFLWCFGDREFIVDLVQFIGGQRITHSYFVPGGVRNDLPKKVPTELVQRFRAWYRDATGKSPKDGELTDDFPKYVLRVMEFLEARLENYRDLMLENSIFIDRTRGVGVLTREMAAELGAVGVSLRASGFRRDVRVDEPYDAYSKFSFEVPVRTEGDSYARAWVAFEEMLQSVRIIRQAVEMMPEGPVKNKQHPINLRVPPGEAVARVEAAHGEMTYYVRSDAADRPYRVRIMTPSFRNLLLVPYLARGKRIADIPVIYWSHNMWPVEWDR
ncbi:MAG: NADH-quinone oxidoreductase subunit D [Thaumarchaeota archaeon]|nr:NADH-quinone oxidoreductase subunit D [Candidatus Calditenuaceae archaeon]MCX8203011.1 NADH-quinone oxidoreductase subunit D [Nitrososphaeria archaeon]MDW8043215.1 NADH-quinone oxidoreductase subunit D [Nitrososphaerota archaeon]